jgi:hypothetical protein
MAYAVDLVAVPEQAIAGIRERGPVDSLISRVQRLRRALEKAGLQPAGPVMARYFEEWREDGDVDYEVAVPVFPGPDAGRLRGARARTGDARLRRRGSGHGGVRTWLGTREGPFQLRDRPAPALRPLGLPGAGASGE